MVGTCGSSFRLLLFSRSSAQRRTGGKGIRVLRHDELGLSKQTEWTRGKQLVLRAPLRSKLLCCFLYPLFHNPGFYHNMSYWKLMHASLASHHSRDFSSQEGGIRNYPREGQRISIATLYWRVREDLSDKLHLSKDLRKEGSKPQIGTGRQWARLLYPSVLYKQTYLIGEVTPIYVNMLLVFIKCNENLSTFHPPFLKYNSMYT